MPAAKRTVKSPKAPRALQFYLLGVALIGIFVTVGVSQQRQETRSNAYESNEWGGSYDGSWGGSHDNHYSYPGTTSMPMPTPKPGDISVADLKYVPAGEPLKSFTITAQVNASGQWTYNGVVPGPTLRVKQGDHVHINFTNKLPESTTIHWHGVNIVGSQDGAAGMTQDAIMPGKTYAYDFVVKDAGTFWYHSHQNTSQQVPKGLMGALVVEPKVATTTYAQDYTIGFNDITAQKTPLTALAGQRVRLRFVNMRVGRWDGQPLKVAVLGAPFKLIAFDGQDINGPQQITSKAIPLGMGQRADVEVTIPSGGIDIIETGGYYYFNSYNSQGSAKVVHVGPGIVRYSDASARSLSDVDLTTYGVRTTDPLLPKTTFDKEYTLTLGSGLTINGQRIPNVPDIRVKQGDLIKIKYVNNSDMAHPMHIHGHVYSLLKFNGKAVTGSPIHMDSITLKPRETAEVAVLANNPGVWMIHCHVLGHAAKGMGMMLMYDNVYTPYRLGGPTNNHPE